MTVREKFKWRAVKSCVSAPPLVFFYWITNQSWNFKVNAVKMKYFMIEKPTFILWNIQNLIHSLRKTHSMLFCGDLWKTAGGCDERQSGESRCGGWGKKERKADKLEMQDQFKSRWWSRTRSKPLFDQTLVYGVSRLLLLRSGVTIWTMRDVLLTAETDSSVTSFSTSMTEI